MLFHNNIIILLAMFTTQDFSYKLVLVTIDIDECELGTHDCDDAAECYNDEGSFFCVCNGGYSGNGTFGYCLGMFYSCNNSLFISNVNFLAFKDIIQITCYIENSLFQFAEMNEPLILGY